MKRQKIIDKISQIVNKSKYIDKNIVTMLDNLSQEKIEKLLIILFEAYKREISLSQEETKTLESKQKALFAEINNIYAKAPLEFVKRLEQKDKRAESQHERDLDNLLNTQ